MPRIAIFRFENGLNPFFNKKRNGKRQTDTEVNVYAIFEPSQIDVGYHPAPRDISLPLPTTCRTDSPIKPLLFQGLNISEFRILVKPRPEPTEEEKSTRNINMSPSGPTMQVIDHSTLGTIRGVILDDGKIDQFRGIPYGLVPERWTDPVLLDGELSIGIFDATDFGPACPQGVGAQGADLGLVGDVPLAERLVVEDESTCLNLVITRPSGLAPDGKVPVLVWVHGGGLSVGCNAWPQYDLAKLVEHLQDHGKPVIGVSINYRIGIFGFLAAGEAGISGNYGLKDQACAFNWIKRNIEGFGGDADSITAIGESAGGICLSTLLATSEPLFHRAVLMSGDITARRPQSMDWQAAMLRENLTYLGLDGYDMQEAVQRLRVIPAAEIVRALPMVQHWSATLDGSFLVDLQSSDLQVANTWCNSILIGDMAHDGTILRLGYLDDPNAREKTIMACEDILGPTATKQIRAAYSLDGDEAEFGMLTLISELRFYLPVLAAGKNIGLPSSTKVRQYHMDQTNPLKGGTHGLASHALDIAFLLRNIEPWLSDADVELCNRLAEEFAGFAYGDHQVLDKSGGDVLAIGPAHQVRLTSPEEYDATYRNGRGNLLFEIGWKKCFALGERLQGVPHPEL